MEYFYGTKHIRTPLLSLKTFPRFPNEITWKISPDQGVFLRMDLQPGSNQFIIN